MKHILINIQVFQVKADGITDKEIIYTRLIIHIFIVVILTILITFYNAEKQL